MAVTYADGSVDSIPLYQYKGMCGFTGETDENGSFLAFGNLVYLVSHLHNSIQLHGHEKSWR